VSGRSKTRAVRAGWALLVVALACRAAAGEITGVASVEDGDSLEIGGRKIRLHGVDAPEGRQMCRRAGKPWRCGQAAANALAEYLGRRTVVCRVRERDRYDRLVADCTLAGESVNAWLVRQGWALAYRRYSSAYVDDEAAARAARRGVWRSEFEPPWAWRAARRHEAPPPAAAPPRGCRIKGNIGQRNRRIYHLPGDPDYDDTRIDPRRGERWFCSEAEARAAGWRRARP
jgi:endonuclease YncB( thermonuclease family)